jgi:hypothetical protein
MSSTQLLLSVNLYKPLVEAIYSTNAVLLERFAAYSRKYRAQRIHPDCSLQFESHTALFTLSHSLSEHCHYTSNTD